MGGGSGRKGGNNARGINYFFWQISCQIWPYRFVTIIAPYLLSNCDWTSIFCPAVRKYIKENHKANKEGGNHSLCDTIISCRRRGCGGLTYKAKRGGGEEGRSSHLSLINLGPLAAAAAAAWVWEERGGVLGLRGGFGEGERMKGAKQSAEEPKLGIVGPPPKRHAPSRRRRRRQTLPIFSPFFLQLWVQPSLPTLP